jgi:hypothetical protein
VREKAEISAQILELKGQLRACDREVTIVSCCSALFILFLCITTCQNHCRVLQ